MTHDPHPQQAEHKEPYRTICVVLVALGLAAVPAIALLGHRRIAVLWAAAGILVLAIVWRGVAIPELWETLDKKGTPTQANE